MGQKKLNCRCRKPAVCAANAEAAVDAGVDKVKETEVGSLNVNGTEQCHSVPEVFKGGCEWATLEHVGGCRGRLNLQTRGGLMGENCTQTGNCWCMA